MSFQYLFRQMHGYRVLPMANDEIERVAMRTAKVLGFTRMRRKAPSFRLGISGADCEAVLKNVKIQLISIQN